MNRYTLKWTVKASTTSQYVRLNGIDVPFNTAVEINKGDVITAYVSGAAFYYGEITYNSSSVNDGTYTRAIIDTNIIIKLSQPYSSLGKSGSCSLTVNYSQTDVDTRVDLLPYLSSAGNKAITVKAKKTGMTDSDASDPATLTVYGVTKNGTHASISGTSYLLLGRGDHNFTVAPDQYYAMPTGTNVTVSGAYKKSYSSSTGALVISDVTGSVTINATAAAQSYTVSGTITNGSLTGGSQTHFQSRTYTIYPASGYGIPETVTVTGASYTYDATSGTVTVSDATENVVITAECPQIAGGSVTLIAESRDYDMGYICYVKLGTAPTSSSDWTYELNSPLAGGMAYCIDKQYNELPGNEGGYEGQYCYVVLPGVSDMYLWSQSGGADVSVNGGAISNVPSGYANAKHLTFTGDATVRIRMDYDT